MPRPRSLNLRHARWKKWSRVGAAVTIRLGPFGPGCFAFMGESHSETMYGVLIAEEGGGRS